MSIKLTIPEACHEDWQKMQPNTDGRHCLSCQKTVVDFSLMTDKEILDYVSSKGDNLCGRFDQHQLNRGLQENKLRKRFSWAYAWGLAAVSFFWGGKAKAQGVVRTEKIRPVSDDKLYSLGFLARMPLDEAKATVVDETTGLPVPFASVSFKKGPAISADSEGGFSLEPFKNSWKILTVTAVGYGSQTIRVDKNTTGAITIYLKPEAEELDAVVVSAIAGSYRKEIVTCTLQGTVGMVSVGREISSSEKMTRVFREWFPKKDVIAYPNPLSPGSTMKVDLQLKETGQYRLELIDAAGKITWIRSMNIPARQFTISVPTQLAWSAGVYWLRISGTHTKNVYNTRVVIQ
jgi:hypothetical protein